MHKQGIKETQIFFPQMHHKKSLIWSSDLMPTRNKAQLCSWKTVALQRGPAEQLWPHRYAVGHFEERGEPALSVATFPMLQLLCKQHSNQQHKSRNNLTIWLTGELGLEGVLHSTRYSMNASQAPPHRQCCLYSSSHLSKSKQPLTAFHFKFILISPLIQQHLITME